MNKELKEFLQAENTISPMVSDLLRQRDIVQSFDFDRETAVLIGRLKACKALRVNGTSDIKRG